MPLLRQEEAGRFEVRGREADDRGGLCAGEEDTEGDAGAGGEDGEDREGQLAGRL